MLAAVGLDAVAAVLNAHAVLVASELDLRTPRRAPIDRHRIDDVSFAKELVTPPLYDEFMRRSGYKGLFALSFGLRHRATQLNLIYHLLSTTLRGEQSELRDALGGFDPGGGVVRTSLLEAEPWPVATPGRGDEHVTMVVEVPQELSEAEQRLVGELGRLEGPRHLPRRAQFWAQLEK